MTNAQALIYSPPAASLPSTWYFLNPTLSAVPEFYAPYVTPNASFSATTPIVYTGDPGVRNPYLSPGYVPSQSTGTPPYAVATAPGTPANTVPAGVPIPVNIAFPTAIDIASCATMFSAALPPPIPAARLFQTPDVYGAGAILNSGYTGTIVSPATTVTLPPALSNATDSGDPWINNQIPNLPSQTVTTPYLCPQQRVHGTDLAGYYPGPARDRVWHLRRRKRRNRAILGDRCASPGAASGRRRRPRPISPRSAPEYLPGVWWEPAAIRTTGSTHTGGRNSCRRR